MFGPPEGGGAPAAGPPDGAGRVALLGAGLCCPLGSLGETIEALRAGRRIAGVRGGAFNGEPGDSGAPGLRKDPAGRGRPTARAFPRELPESPKFRRMRKYMSGQSLLAAVASRAALEAADIGRLGFPMERVGLFAGVGLASVDHLAGAEILSASLDAGGAFDPERFSAGGLNSLNPLWAFESLANMPACIVSVLEGVKGESAVYAPYEDAGMQALCEAAEALDFGLVDLALVLASDSPHAPSNLAELTLLGHLGDDDVASEAAAALVLARPGDAGDKSAPILGNFQTSRVAGLAGGDPLAPLLGRTMTAAPLILVVLSALCPGLSLPRTITGSLGRRLSFEVLG
ncbi:MAG: hypothetical protein LBO05_10335 [Deltaproteobacteria bacterium]|nr:hypothetical protein [Deltaproteobacteria bacterium]